MEKAIAHTKGSPSSCLKVDIVKKSASSANSRASASQTARGKCAQNVDFTKGRAKGNEKERRETRRDITDKGF